MGHGNNSFKAKYMDYQANYFKNSSESKYKPLADNVKHPFNEFIKLTVEYGVIGLTIVLLLIIFVIRKIKKSNSEFGLLALTGLVSFIVFACFSYPLQYIAIWLMLTFYLLPLFVTKNISIKNTPVLIAVRVAVIITCTTLLLNTYKQIVAEIKWKETAMNSLSGKTKAMLPEYEKLYPVLKNNPFFLYNYGAELNVAGEFDKSISKLNECKKRFNDYDLQMLLADN